MSDTDPIERLLVELRPKLHRYCSRMTGSVIDGEDVVQEALMKAIEALPQVGRLTDPEAWLFRIAHNTALDFLRRRARRDTTFLHEDPDMMSDPSDMVEAPLAAAASLHTFMRLPASQRSTVILMDVLGYSMEEITGIIEISLPAVKSSLHRGRDRLRELADEPEDAPPPTLTKAERTQLAAYIERFNARDFDGVRDMLAEEVKLDLVTRVRWSDKPQVSNYLSNYSRRPDWLFTPGFVERRPAVLVRDPSDPVGKPIYFILLQWSDGKVADIRDFRYARYAVEAADMQAVD